jgi:hypothetical protein
MDESDPVSPPTWAPSTLTIEELEVDVEGNKREIVRDLASRSLSTTPSSALEPFRDPSELNSLLVILVSSSSAAAGYIAIGPPARPADTTPLSKVLHKKVRRFESLSSLSELDIDESRVLLSAMNLVLREEEKALVRWSVIADPTRMRANRVNAEDNIAYILP